MRFDDIGNGGNRAPASAPGKTYYPVNPLGPYTGPTAADFPTGQPAATPGTPATSAPSSGLGGIVDALRQRNMAGAGGGTYYPVNPLGPHSGATAANPPVPGAAPPAAGYQRSDPAALISALPQQRQDRMTQRWGTIGGGAPMPTTVGDFRTAAQTWRQSRPSQYPGQWPQWPGHRGNRMMGQ